MLVSPSWNESKWCRKELSHVLYLQQERQVAVPWIFPVRLSNEPLIGDLSSLECFEAHVYGNSWMMRLYDKLDAVIMQQNQNASQPPKEKKFFNKIKRIVGGILGVAAIGGVVAVALSDDESNTNKSE